MLNWVTVGSTSGMSVTNCSWMHFFPRVPPQDGQEISFSGTSMVLSTFSGRGRKERLPYFLPGLRPGFLGFLVSLCLENGAAWRFPARSASSRCLRSLFTSRSSMRQRRQPVAPRTLVSRAFTAELSAGAITRLNAFSRTLAFPRACGRGQPIPRPLVRLALPGFGYRPQPLNTPFRPSTRRKTDTVHVVQWDVLGVNNFLLAYGLGCSSMAMSAAHWNKWPGSWISTSAVALLSPPSQTSSRNELKHCGTTRSDRCYGNMAL